MLTYEFSYQSLPWSTRYLPGAYYSAYLLYQELDMEEEALHYRSQARQWYIDLQGPLSPDYISAFN